VKYNFKDFQQPLLHSSVSQSFRNHSNMLIWCSRNIFLLIIIIIINVETVNVYLPVQKCYVCLCVCVWFRVTAALCRPHLLHSTLPFAALPPLICFSPPLPHEETSPSPLTPTLWLEKGRYKMKDGATDTS